MLLVDVQKHNNWLLSRWNLTYQVEWKQLLKAVYSIYDQFDNAEVLTGKTSNEVSSKEEIMNLAEGHSLVIRGDFRNKNVPVMITFFTQTNLVDVSVARKSDEFWQADYKKFNTSIGPYMDGLEIAMYK